MTLKNAAQRERANMVSNPAFLLAICHLLRMANSVFLYPQWSPAGSSWGKRFSQLGTCFLSWDNAVDGLESDGPEFMSRFYHPGKLLNLLCDCL